MLLKRDLLHRIQSGEVDLVYRRWSAPRVKKGTRLRTAVGVVEVVAIEEVEPGRLAGSEIRRGGFSTAEEVLNAAGNRGPILYRIELRHGGPDPRVALRGTTPKAEELEEIKARLRRLDLSAPGGPWAEETLRLIAENPGVRAAELAQSVGREKLPFKVDVRKLKELGLTESLEIGYRLSPRGEALLRALPGKSG